MEPIPQNPDHAARRNLSIRSAVLTSFLSKAGTAFLQLLAIPIAIRVLGREEFGLFITVTLTLTTVSLLEVGVGPALAHGVARANALGDTERRRELASTAFLMMAGIALLAGILLAAVLASVPLPTLFGEGFAGREAAMRPALWLGLGLFLMLFLLNLSERLREGQLEVAKTNLWGALGNLVAAAAVGIGVLFVPQVWFLVLAVNGSVVLAKLANTATLWWKHPDFAPKWRAFRLPLAQHLLRDGLSFATATLLTGVVEYNLCGWMVGRAGGPHDTALFGIFVSLSVMQLGFVIMLTAPTWPAIAEAIARGDRAWAARAARRLQAYGLAVGICAAVGLTTFGPWIFGIWLGPEFADTSRSVLACFGFFFAAHVWRHVHHTLMIGTGQVTRLARVQLIETTVVAVVAWAALHSGGLAVMLAAMGATILCITGTLLPRLVAVELKRSGP
jgi:O-antigen/teichoic acid export membrane protein